MDDKNKLDVNDSLLEYYTLKREYEKQIKEAVEKIISNPKYSKITKRKKFQELQKPKCINCKQNVGTIFERKYYDEYENKSDVIVYTAKCGNILNPCDLNIEIHKSLRESYDKLINKNQEYLNEEKLKIIKLKNKILFLGKKNINENEYIDEFENYKNAILNYSEIIGQYTEENIMINDNPEDQEKLMNLMESLNQQEIIQFKDYIKEYMETNNESILTNAINMYINEILPKVKEIRDLKYKTMYVTKYEMNKVLFYKLVQSKYSPEGLNFYDENVDEVVHFVRGSKIESEMKKSKKIKISKKENLEDEGEEEQVEEIKKSKKSKTLKNVSKSSTSKTKTRKLKISNEDILEEENDLEIVVPTSNKDEEEEEEISIETPKKDSSIKFVVEDEDQDEDEEEIIIRPSTKISSVKISEEEEEQKQIKPRKIGKIGRNIVLNEATEAI